MKSMALQVDGGSRRSLVTPFVVLCKSPWYLLFPGAEPTREVMYSTAVASAPASYSSGCNISPDPAAKCPPYQFYSPDNGPFMTSVNLSLGGYESPYVDSYYHPNHYAHHHHPHHQQQQQQPPPPPLHHDHLLDHDSNYAHHQEPGTVASTVASEMQIYSSGLSSASSSASNEMQIYVASSSPNTAASGLQLKLGKKRNPCNKKERKRTVSINTAFSLLRDRIPNVPTDTKLSKIKTLRLAINYIGYLSKVLEQSSSHERGKNGVPLSCEDFKVNLQRFKGIKSENDAVSDEHKISLENVFPRF